MELDEPNTAPPEKGISVINPVSFAFVGVVDYRTYRLPLRSPLYDERVSRGMGKWQDLEVAMKTRYFIASDPVTILPFVNTIRRECDILRILAGAATWLLPTYLSDPARETLQSRMYRQGTKTPEA